MSASKRILITNDDGLSSPGLTSLVRELLAAGHDLRVAAPAQEQSGVGHAITLHEPLYVEEVKLPAPLEGVPAYKVEGTPADCVKIAITNLFPDFQPDLVLSGINRGPNVGMNVLYSGTVAGALEACICELPALALSLDVPPDGIWHFALASEIARPVIEAALVHGLPKWSILNVNIPNRPQAQIKGVRLTKHGSSGFKEYYIEENRSGARRRFRLEGEMIFRDDDESIDAVALRQGWVSVTPLGLCLENPQARAHVAGWKLFS